jgi:hypothetical protein
VPAVSTLTDEQTTATSGWYATKSLGSRLAFRGEYVYKIKKLHFGMADFDL